MTIEDQNGVDRVDRKARWPHFLNKETRFCFLAQRVTNMRWGRRCWDCPDRDHRRGEDGARSRWKATKEYVFTVMTKRVQILMSPLNWACYRARLSCQRGAFRHPLLYIISRCLHQSDSCLYPNPTFRTGPSRCDAAWVVAVGCTGGGLFGGSFSDATEAGQCRHRRRWGPWCGPGGWEQGGERRCRVQADRRPNGKDCLGTGKQTLICCAPCSGNKARTDCDSVRRRCCPLSWEVQARARTWFE